MTLQEGVLPWTKSCFVCGENNPRGLRLRSRLQDGVVVIDYTTREGDLGWKHIIHGGIAMTLLDEVMTWAVILETRAACVAAEMTTRLRRPISVGQRLRVEGRVTGGKSRLILTEGFIRDESDQVLTSATGKYLPMPGDKVELCAEDFVESDLSIPVGEIL